MSAIFSSKRLTTEKAPYDNHALRIGFILHVLLGMMPLVRRTHTKNNVKQSFNASICHGLGAVDDT